MGPPTEFTLLHDGQEVEGFGQSGAVLVTEAYGDGRWTLTYPGAEARSTRDAVPAVAAQPPQAEDREHERHEAVSGTES